MDIASAGRKRPIVERVAGWSVRHRVIVVVSWLLIVVAAFAVGQHLGTSNTNSYDPGQAGRAERILNQPAVQQPDAESVLIQGRSAAQTFAGDLELRQTVRQVVAALERLPGAAADIQSPFTSAGLVDGRSALVTFNVAGSPANDDTAVVPALNAVAAIQARHPGLTVSEAGGASVDRTANALVGQDFWCCC
jgi:putative drug exporter of the RND superfamily